MFHICAIICMNRLFKWWLNKSYYQLSKHSQVGMFLKDGYWCVRRKAWSNVGWVLEMAAKPLLFSGRFFLFHGHDLKNQRNQVWYVIVVLKQQQQQDKAIFYKAMVSSSWRVLKKWFEEVISMSTLWCLAGIWIYEETLIMWEPQLNPKNRPDDHWGLFLFLKINMVISNWLHLDMIWSRVIDMYGQTQATCSEWLGYGLKCSYEPYMWPMVKSG
jgi:hypothetical protein